VDGAVICASAGCRAEAAKAVIINVAVSIDLMTNLAPLKRAQLSTSDWSATAKPWFKGLDLVATEQWPDTVIARSEATKQSSLSLRPWIASLRSQ
jgi:hypothetical protein